MIKGKVVIVTGAARGLGQKYIIELAKEGAQVVFADINDCNETEAKVSEITNDYLSLNLDVTEFDSCGNLVTGKKPNFGYILINRDVPIVKPGFDVEFRLNIVNPGY